MSKNQFTQFRIKSRLADLNITQVTLLDELKKRGIRTNPSELSNALRGIATYDKASQIVSMSNEIIIEWERQA